MKAHSVRFLASTVLIAFVFGCGGGGGGNSTPPSGLNAQLIVGGLTFPTALRFTPDGAILVTEKSTGKLRKIVGGVMQPDPVATFSVGTTGEQGLLGLAIDPNYAVNKFVYVYHTTSNGLTNQVVRVLDDPINGPDPTVIVSGLPAAANHDGGRIEIGPDGKLYVSLGDVLDPSNSQSNATTAGKILRYNLDGSIPGDNPIVGNPLYSKGHRNCFGMAIDPGTGTVFVSENGPDCDDEVNRLTPGGNYGWRPSQPCNDVDPLYLAPILRFSAVFAPTGMAIGTGAFQNSLLMGSFNDRQLRQIRLTSFPSGSVTTHDVIYTSPSDRIIDVTMDPSGNPVIATTDFGNDGKILRLVP